MKLPRILLMMLMAVAIFHAPVWCAEKPAECVKPEGSSAPLGNGSDFESDSIQTAPVMLDGKTLLRVRGVSSFPAENRAESIRKQILTLARDRSFKIKDLKIEDKGVYLAIMRGDAVVMRVFDTDAQIEGIDKGTLAAVIVQGIGQAVEEYQAARALDKLLWAGIYALIATILFVLAIILITKNWGRLNAVLDRRYKDRLDSVETKSRRIIRADQLWSGLHGLLKTFYIAIILSLAYGYVNYVLNLFPWTRTLGQNMLNYILDPLKVMGTGVLNFTPSFMFLIIIFIITRYVLKILHSFFNSIGQGSIAFEGFEPEWARPTFKITRYFVIALAAIFAYPYMPGSGSEAFKGISLFLGVLVSLGSSSIISNIIAGYTLVYRQPYKIGDRVKINNTIGDVIRIRNLVTHLQTIHNEEIIIPNSEILNGEVLNYCSLLRKQKLILPTTVGIGYGVPWRQVEAMLLLAADRTPKILKDSAPFVRQIGLGDFAITYELNAYCDDPWQMPQIYTQLHRNILDLFNEYGVQIMTPSYEGDPEQAKVVPRENWHAAPAGPAD